MTHRDITIKDLCVQHASETDRTNPTLDVLREAHHRRQNHQKLNQADVTHVWKMTTINAVFRTYARARNRWGSAQIWFISDEGRQPTMDEGRPSLRRVLDDDGDQGSAGPGANWGTTVSDDRDQTWRLWCFFSIRWPFILDLPEQGCFSGHYTVDLFKDRFWNFGFLKIVFL